MKIVTVKQLQAIERSADASGLTYAMMMQHAGQGIASWVLKNLPIKSGVIGLVGSGNNGGDTLIALTTLAMHGVRTVGFLVKHREDDPLIDAFIQSGGCLIDISENQHFEYLVAALQPGVILLDGILGTGLRLPLRGGLVEVMGRIHDLVKNRPGALIIAVDCPSGMDCDTGEVSDVTLHAKHTLSMAAIKQGLLRHPGRSFVGELHLIKIGIEQITQHLEAAIPEMIDDVFAFENLPARPDFGHKGTFGTCMVIAGTAAYTGAAYLTGKAAYRAGCGLVSIATLPIVHQSLSGQLIEAVWTILPEVNGSYDKSGVFGLKDQLYSVDSLVLGPGWGLAEENVDFLQDLLEVIPNDLPVLFDADGLKLLKNLTNWWERLPKQTILTPHPGEMALLTGLTINEIQSDRWLITQDYAMRWKVVLLLKGAMTVISTPDGALFVNPVSDPALATAGSGDVLSGIIGGLLAQGLPYDKTASLGAWLHGKAGEIARITLGTDISVTARDILDSIPNAMDYVVNGRKNN